MCCKNRWNSVVFPTCKFVYLHWVPIYFSSISIPRFRRKQIRYLRTDSYHYCSLFEIGTSRFVSQRRYRFRGFNIISWTLKICINIQVLRDEPKHFLKILQAWLSWFPACDCFPYLIQSFFVHTPFALSSGENSYLKIRTQKKPTEFAKQKKSVFTILY